MKIIIQTHFRVSYSDTDQMGFMHHSSYLKYYETARWELFRSIGIPYKSIEDEDIIFPVTEASIRYIKPARYDQDITVDTTIKSFRGPRVIFEYRAANENSETINEARITVASVKKSTGKACSPPKKLLEKIKDLMNR